MGARGRAAPRRRARRYRPVTVRSHAHAYPSEATMTDPASTATDAPRLALGDGRSGVRRRRRARADRGLGQPPLRPRRDALVERPARPGDDRRPTRLARGAPTTSPSSTAGLEGFGDAVLDAGFTTAIVAGMGGSSLAPDVLHRTFGSQEGYLALRILDSTDPGVRRRDRRRPRPAPDPRRSSPASPARRPSRTPSWPMPGRGSRPPSTRSGTTPTSSPATVFAAITDPGQSLDAIPHHDDFREVFLNPPDIGGRYSALTLRRARARRR